MKNEQLIAGIKNKDNQAYSYLYQQYGPMITAYVLKNSGSKEDGMELIQVTILKIWDIIQTDKYEDRGKFGQFVYTVAANSWKQILRQRRKSPTQALGDGELFLQDEGVEDLHWKLAKDEKIDAIYQAINQLDETCKELINLFHFDKVSLLEISKQKNYPYNNLKKRIFGCRKKLKKLAIPILSH